MSDLSKKLEDELSLLLDSISGLTGAIETVSTGTTGETLQQLVDTATTQANDSATSAAQAATIQLEIQNSILAAQTADLNAATGAANAAIAASNSLTYSQNAGNSATAAAGSATAAATSATSAASAATSANNAANNAIALASSWASVWLGQHTADPTLDNSGGALISGAMYMNTTTTPPHLRIYLNGAWQDQDADAIAATQAAQASATQASMSASTASTQATNAAASATAAANSATAAATSETNAAASATSAASSASNIAGQIAAATTQAGNASGSATNAATSASAAAASATAAAGSASDAATSATGAGTQASAAASSATASSNSANAANTSASSAAGSATDAATSATNASNSATAAASSASDASSSAGIATTKAGVATTQAGNASTSASNAATSASAAAGSATAAGTSATNAANSASAAAASASDADTQAATAATQATNAGTSATAAAGSATAAATSATNAGNSATAAAASQSAAHTSELNAATSATTAGTQATNASGSATAAAASATAAATSETNAGNSASAAAGSATAAAGSASAASTSAGNAAASATTATNAANAATALYHSWGQMWLGEFTTNPTQDNQGGALVSGAQYLNTSTTPPQVMIYLNGAWGPLDADAQAATQAAQTSASQAAASATTASNQASTATTQAGNASTSATNAANSATAAAGSASAASTSAGNASSSATAAAGSATAASGSATTASTQATNAGNSATAAAGSATAASTSATNASTSATTAQNWASQGSGTVDGTSYSAKYYANQAGISATNAASSASAAATSETNAAASATTASNQATTATTQAGNASSSASAASTSATNAASSATAASGSATTASTQATNASNSATLAQNWASQPSGVVGGTSSYSAVYYANQASASATAASTSASNASGSASAAASSATAASNSASAAATNQTNSANSATSASGSAGSAATSATNASNSATAASTSATNASTSATNAANSATAAATSATNASNSATAAQTAATTAQNVQIGLNTITTLSKTGGTYSLTTAEYNNGIIIVNGTLTSPLILVVPATSHPFILDNATTGAYSLTVKMTGGSAQVTVAQGNSNQLFCDGSTGVYSVSSVSGLQFNAVKAISSATNALTNLYQGAYTPMSNGGGTTYAVTLPQGSTMGVGGAVFLDAISGKWSVAPYSGDTADFGASFAMGPVDKAMFTWNGSSWRTTLYSNQASPVFSQSLTVPVAYITGRAVIGGVTDDGTTAVQATSGRFTSSLTVPTMTAGDNSLNAANTAYVVTAINNLIGGAPSALNTLKELADAINDDASYAASITTQLGTKASLSGANFTGAVTATALTSTTGVVNAYGYSGSNSKGVIYFTQDGTRYLYYDGSQYNLPGASLLINGSAAWTAATFNPANYAALAGAAAFGGAVTGTAATYALRATNGAGTGQTTIGLNAVGAATDAKNWEVIMGSDQSFGIRTINDAYSASNYALQVYRSGYAITTMRIMGSGGRTLIGTGTQVSDDGATNVQVGAGLRVQRTSSSGQAISLMPAPLNTVSGSNLSDNYITSYSATGNAKSLVLNATTDTADTASTAGNVSLMLQVMSTTALAVTSTRNVIIGSSTDDGSGNILQVRGGLGIIGNGKGITFPDGTVQNTAYCVTAPTVMSYTPANGVSTFSCQPYGVGLVQVFENGALITEYTATTGNSITLNTAANGRTQYTVVSGVLFQASNVLQPAVSVVNPTVGTTTLTLPVSTPVGYLWIFQGGAWLVPGQDFTFNGGTSVTLTAATTQSSDSFTLVMLQPVSFANTATQSNVQAAQLTFAADTGVANAYAVAYIPAVSTPTNGMQLSFFANVANTGASTLTCNGGTAYPIYGNGHAALTGGEIVANGFVEVTFSSVLGGWILMECTGGSQQIAKNLNFAGTGNRITGDLSNATVANRLLVQSSTVNGNSVLGIVPNGTSTTSAINVYGGSDLVNYSLGQMANYGTDLRFQAVQAGTGSYLPLTFYTSGAERMRVTPAGLVGINATGPSIAGTRLMVKATAAEWPAEIANTNTNGVAGGLLLMQVFQTNSQYVQFFYGAGTIVGSITTNGSSTAYGTTSDYRLKENVKPLQGALQRVMQAKPIRYNFKTDETKTQVDGFLAHELAEVIPEAVVGEKDKVTYRPVLREGHDPKDIHPHDVLDLEEHVEAQIVDHSKMVPLLTAALQEANVEIEQLKKDRDILRKQMDEMMQQMKLLMQKH